MRGSCIQRRHGVITYTTIGTMLIGACSGHSTQGSNGALQGPTFCEVAPIIQANCVTCHADPPQFGAPMSLVHGSDFLSWMSLVETRLHDPRQPMPPSGALSASELATLDAWFANGMREGGCSEVKPNATDSNPPLPCQPDTFVQASEVPGDIHQQTLAPHEVPIDDDSYGCFSVRMPAARAQQLIAASPLIDKKSVLHHMILYTVEGTNLRLGPHDCNERPNEAQAILRWEPGGKNIVFPDDVGFALGDHEVQFDLEVHYHNHQALPGVLDTSGFALCTSTTPRAHQAALVNLGTVDFVVPAGTTAQPGEVTFTNTCRPSVTEPTHILSAMPHMHFTGHTLRTDIVRSGGTIEPLVDVESFHVDNQPAYPSAAVLQPGDTLRTTCSFSNPETHPVSFGARAKDEMCFDYVVYWPAGQLHMAGAATGDCIDPAEVQSHQPAGP